MKNLLYTLLILSLQLVPGTPAHGATLEINGDVTQNLDANNSPISALAVGPLAKADASVNTVRGSAKVGGSVTQTARMRNSPVSAAAIGPGAKASAKANAVEGD